MQIRFERSGGFAGLTLSTTIDPDELPPEEAKDLLETLDDSGVLTRPNEQGGGPESTPDSPPAPLSYIDEMNYTITIEVSGYEHTVHVTESEMTPELTELFRCLTQLARRASRP